MDDKRICKIRDIYRAISMLEMNFEKKFDLNINEMMLLCTLNSNDNLTSGEIAKALELTCSNASKVIRSVEKKSLINRIMDKEDMRHMHFSLTKKGKERLSTIKCDEIVLPEILSGVLKA